jgi:two-component system response regulator HydG
MSASHRLLIVDDDRRMAKTLKDILQLKGLNVETADNALKALEYIHREAFDSVLADIKMPGMNGVELYKTIHAEKPELPVVLMSAYTPRELIDEALAAGAVAALEKPLDIDQILAYFSYLRNYHTIAMVDDDPDFCHAIAEILGRRGFEVIEIVDAERLMYQTIPDAQIVLLDVKLNGISGLEVLKHIRDTQPKLPVVLMTSYRKEYSKAIQQALQIQANTCLYKPFDVEELIKVISEIRNRQLGLIFNQV